MEITDLFNIVKRVVEGSNRFYYILEDDLAKSVHVDLGGNRYMALRNYRNNPNDDEPINDDYNYIVYGENGEEKIYRTNNEYLEIEFKKVFDKYNYV